MTIGLHIYIFSTIIHLALSAGILYNLKKAGEFEKTDIAFFGFLAICPVVNTILVLVVAVMYVKRLLNIIEKRRVEMTKFIRFTQKSKDIAFKDITIGKLYEVKEHVSGYEYIVDDIGDENSIVLRHTLWIESKDKRPHYDLRIAHANGADIESSMDEGVTWGLNTEPLWREDTLYRIAIPKAPVRVFPVTSLTGDDLNKIYCASRVTFKENLVLIANAAIRRYIEDTENE